MCCNDMLLGVSVLGLLWICFCRLVIWILKNLLRLLLVM